MIRKAKILIVEDESDVAFLIRDILKLYNQDILLAEKGADAFSLLDTQPIKSVISDVTLPDMNGLQLYQKIRQQFPDLRLKFLFMSGYRIDENFQDFLKETNNHFIQKPFQLNEFIELVSPMI